MKIHAFTKIPYLLEKAQFFQISVSNLFFSHFTFSFELKYFLGVEKLSCLRFFSFLYQQIVINNNSVSCTYYYKLWKFENKIRNRLLKRLSEYLTDYCIKWWNRVYRLLLVIYHMRKLEF